MVGEKKKSALFSSGDFGGCSGLRPGLPLCGGVHGGAVTAAGRGGERCLAMAEGGGRTAAAPSRCWLVRSVSSFLLRALAWCTVSKGSTHKHKRCVVSSARSDGKKVPHQGKVALEPRVLLRERGDAVYQLGSGFLELLPSRTQHIDVALQERLGESALIRGR